MQEIVRIQHVLSKENKWPESDIRAQNLRQGIMKTSFKTRVLRMGLGSFVDISIFAMKYYFFQFVYILHFIRICQIKIYRNVKTPKRKLDQRYSLNFGLLGVSGRTPYSIVKKICISLSVDFLPYRLYTIASKKIDDYRL